jgi:hypothetical protein
MGILSNQVNLASRVRALECVLVRSYVVKKGFNRYALAVRQRALIDKGGALLGSLIASKLMRKGFKHLEIHIKAQNENILKA